MGKIYPGRRTLVIKLAWYYIDPTDVVPGVGCIMRQYSGNVYISLQGYTGYVDQDSCLYAVPHILSATIPRMLHKKICNIFH